MKFHFDEHPNTRDALEIVDPDWRDHWFDADIGIQFYREHAPDAWAEALAQLRLEEEAA